MSVLNHQCTVNKYIDFCNLLYFTLGTQLELVLHSLLQLTGKPACSEVKGRQIVMAKVELFYFGQESPQVWVQRQETTIPHCEGTQ